MPPTVILIRHAQALHNVSEDYTIPDPGLTPLGFEQCQQLRARLQARLRPGQLAPEVVLVSPMKRTLQTALASLDWLGVPIVAHAGWQETTDHTCDIGSPIADMAAAFPAVDFASVDPVFPDKLSPQAAAYAYNRRALVARGQRVLAELHTRPERVIAVVSHSSFLSKAVAGAMFGNADFRIFDWAPVGEEQGAFPDMPPLVYRLQEWEETRQGRGGMGWSYDTVRQIGEGLPQ